MVALIGCRFGPQTVDAGLQIHEFYLVANYFWFSQWVLSQQIHEFADTLDLGATSRGAAYQHAWHNIGDQRHLL